MKKQEFLNILRSALSDSIPSNAIQYHIEYYNDYITSEVRMGKSEEEVIESLGNPRLIAKTISSAKDYNHTSQNEHKENYQYDNEAKQNQDAFRKKGFTMDYNNEGGIDYKYGRLKLNSWYGKLIGIVIAIILCIFVFLVLGGLTFVFMKLLIPLLIVIVIVALIRRRR